jgi:hypothetical protein
MNAINDALRPFGAKVFAQPFTPERILAALGKVPARWPTAAPATGARPYVTPAVAEPTGSPKPAGFLAKMFGRDKAS